MQNHSLEGGSSDPEAQTRSETSIDLPCDADQVGAAPALDGERSGIDDDQNPATGVSTKKNAMGDPALERSASIIGIRESESLSGERVCRICQLSSENLPAGNSGVVSLGCSCKDELGISHYHCAQAWFKQKGNRMCEICGKPAKNIAGIQDTGFRSYGGQTNEMTPIGIAGIPMAVATRSIQGDQSSHLCGKFVCNFLLASLLLAFLLPWVFRPIRL